MEECNNDNGKVSPSIPDHMTWTVTMWHFGADALITYEGEKFTQAGKLGSMH